MKSENGETVGRDEEEVERSERETKSNFQVKMLERKNCVCKTLHFWDLKKKSKFGSSSSRMWGLIALWKSPLKSHLPLQWCMSSFRIISFCTWLFHKEFEESGAGRLRANIIRSNVERTSCLLESTNWSLWLLYDYQQSLLQAVIRITISVMGENHI